MAGPTKTEIRYMQELQQIPGDIPRSTVRSVQEGFEYCMSKAYAEQYPEQKMSFKNFLFSNGFRHFTNLVGIMLKYKPKMIKDIKACFTELDPYMEELRVNGRIKPGSELKQSFPNFALWKELQNLAWEKWQMKIGFTRLDNDLIFKGKSVFFRNVIVCIQEMKKDKIDLAPTIDAGGEVQRVYYSLGHAINEMAHLLREKYGIKCQTSHPLGGLVNTPPLAGKAGMGWQGLDGLLITPEYGKRNRIAPIFIEEKLFEFTDNHDHQWIELYCPSCRLCQKNCPTGAILTEKIPSTALVEGIKVQTSIDRIKCFPQFTKTLGCSICIKSCPFSGGPKAYERIKRSFDRNHKQLMKT